MRKGPLAWVVIRSVRLSSLPHVCSVETGLHDALLQFVDVTHRPLCYNIGPGSFVCVVSLRSALLRWGQSWFR